MDSGGTVEVGGLRVSSEPQSDTFQLFFGYLIQVAPQVAADEHFPPANANDFSMLAWQIYWQGVLQKNPQQLREVSS